MSLGPGQLHLMSMAKQITRDKWAPTPADHTAKSERPPHSAGGLFTRKVYARTALTATLPCHLSCLSFVIVIINVMNSFHYGMCKCEPLQLLGEWWHASFSDSPRPPGTASLPSGPSSAEGSLLLQVWNINLEAFLSWSWILQTIRMSSSFLDKMVLNSWVLSCSQDPGGVRLPPTKQN